METQELKSIVEALIFAADEPLSEARIRETLELENGFDFGAVIEALNQEYQNGGRAFTIRKIAGGYQIVTQQNYASWIRKLYLGRQKNRLSHAALETLALIAFKQPISRVDIAQIRGVNSDGVIGTLLERKLVTISGRSEAVGRPLLYSTTAEFLKYFGINDIADLPKPREIEELFSKEGMPEELLQALSQTDAQLSLPINGDGETPAASDITEKEIARTETPALPPSFAEIPPRIDAPTEAVEITSSETISVPAAANVAGDNDNPEVMPVATTPLLTSEIPAVDINEEVVSQLEVADNVAAALPASSPTVAGENEIAWISLNNDTDDLAGQPAANELVIDDLTEIAPDLPAFAGVSEVVSDALAAETRSVVDVGIEPKLASLDAMTEEMTTDFVRSDAVTDDRAELAQESFVAGIAEVVAMVAESPAAEVQVIEAYDVGQNRSAPPELQTDAVEEVDGWVAEELSPEEIAEPDFIKKSEDFFLEGEPQPAIEPVATTEPDVPVFLSEAEPIVVETLPEQSAHVTVVDFPEPTIVESIAGSTPAIVDDTVLTRTFEETEKPAALETTSIREETTTIAASLAIPEAAVETQIFSQPDLEAVNKSDIELQQEVVAAPVFEFAASPVLENDDNQPATWRERMVGWMKRTFTRLLTLMGARI
jgi:segregation and condensation protein B